MTGALIRHPRLWAGREGRRATWAELFFDLIFVAAIAQAGEPLHHHYSLGGLLRYSFLFLLIWWAWNGHTLYHSRFDCDDWLNRFLTIVQTFIAAVMAANATEELDSESAAGFAAAYAGMRLILVIQYLRVRHLPEARELAGRSATGYGAAAAIWLASALIEPPLRYWAWALALTIDIATHWFAHRHTSAVPPDAHHFPERFGLFTIILFGEFVAAVMRGIQSQEDWSVPAASAAFAGLTFAFILRAWYFDGAQGTRERRIRTREQARHFQLWNYAHLPLFLGIGVAGIGFRRMINTDDSIRLTLSEAVILCCSVAVIMLALVLIEKSGEPQCGARRLRKVLALQIAIAALVAGFSWVAPLFPLIGVALALLGACAAQVWLAHRLTREDEPRNIPKHGADTSVCESYTGSIA